MNKTTAALLGLLMTASLANAGHPEPDGDEFPGFLEDAICGTGGGTSGMLVNLVGLAGSCDGTGNYTFSAGGAPTPCGGCSTQVILDETDMPITPAHDIGPLSTPPTVNVTTFEAYYDTVNSTPTANIYCVDLRPQAPKLACANVGPVTTIPPVGPIHIANATVPQQHAPATSMDVRIEYRFIDANITFCCSVGSGPLVEAYYPADPFSAADVAWWLQNGNQTSLDIFLEPRLDGTPTGTPVQVSIPYLGQAIATAMKSSPTNPFPL